MAIKSINMTVNSYVDKNGSKKRNYDLDVQYDFMVNNKCIEDQAMAQNFTLDDLKWLRSELAKSINLEKNLRNDNI